MEGPPWLESLGEAARADARFDLATARAALAGPPPPSAEWEHVRELLALRTTLREGRGDTLPSLLARCEQLLGLPLDRATRCRVLHTNGVLQVRMDLHAQAEVTLCSALELAEDDARVRLWILDSLGQCYQGQASWTEARRLLREVMRQKHKAGDRVGMAISAGNLALLELGLGAAQAADEAVGRALAEVAGHVPAMTRMRLETLRVQARLGTPEAGPAARTLETTLDALGAGTHHLKAYAALALARALPAEATRWLDIAEQNFTSAADLAHLQYWRLQLCTPPGESCDEQVKTLQALCAAAPPDSEAALMAHLALAGAPLPRTQVQHHLASAYRCALRGNHPLWMERVDTACERLDPEGFRWRLLERYTGRGDAELLRTTKEDATFIFADLVGFTARSQSLSPEETMETVRSLFELTVPLLVRYRARPLQYLGDGLLAICQGDGHAARGLAFSRMLVARSLRASAVRKALGEDWGLMLRAGVASGTAVLGIIGSHHKLDFQAIGRSVNLSARLQGQAEPGEVVASRRCAEAAGVSVSGLAWEYAALKGFPEPEPFVRFSISPSERPGEAR
ncbi:MAG: adenylate/guanylate cyclase domain-containing protein [Deltaproteobacteria bacterium]|nr:adenylate/guanylate cyclase domain-containing protein [Deltaproteobacteria bacterium]